MAAAAEVCDGLHGLSLGCKAMGSPLYATVFERASSAYAAGGAVRSVLDACSNPARAGLLFAAAAHFRALKGDAPRIAAHFPSTGGDGDALAAWTAIEDDVEANQGAYSAFCSSTVQTNEVARALPLLAGILTVAAATGLPLRIFEVGSSAGFLLNLDRYRYEGERWSWGAPDARLVLRDLTGGRPVHHDARLTIVERRGCDLAPVDATRAEGANRLLSFVWADQLERLERLRCAIAVANEHPPQVDRADGVEWIAQNVFPVNGLTTVAFHSVMVEHMLPSQRDALYGSIRVLGSKATVHAPFAWVRMESPGADAAYETRVTVWPDGYESLAAKSDGHAGRLRWIDPDA